MTTATIPRLDLPLGVHAHEKSAYAPPPPPPSHSFPVRTAVLSPTHKTPMYALPPNLAPALGAQGGGLGGGVGGVGGVGVLGASHVPAMGAPSVHPLKETQDAEMAMWKAWNQGGRQPEHLRPLLHSLQPLIHKSITPWTGRVKNIPDEAFEAEALKHTMDALRSYDPSHGAKLSTWVQTALMKTSRFGKTYQNVGRIVEERQTGIAEFKNAKQHLADTLNRPPSDTELLSHLQATSKERGWSMPEIKRMNLDLRADILSSTFESDIHQNSPTLDNEVMHFLHEQLDPEEAKVYERIVHPHATQGKTGLIARELGWSDAKVSRIRKRIEQKATVAMKGLTR